MSDGGWSPDGTFHQLPHFDPSLVERIFQAELLRMLVQRELIGQQVVENLLSWRHSGFSVHGEVRVESRHDAARLGRYMLRCPLVLERLSLDEATGEILYRARPHRATGHPLGDIARWDLYEFIATLLVHLPPPRQQLVRYWGYYSNVARGRRRAAARTDPGDRDDAQPLTLPAPDDEPHRRRARLTWAKLIKKIYEVDPLLCPYCGSQMKIIAFITEHSSVRRILRHLGRPPQRPEPLAHSPPAEPDILDFELLEIT